MGACDQAERRGLAARECEERAIRCDRTAQTLKRRGGRRGRGCLAVTAAAADNLVVLGPVASAVARPGDGEADRQLSRAATS